MFTREKTNLLSIRWCLTLELQERGAVRQGLSLAFCQSFGHFFFAKFCWGNKAGTEKALELFPHAHLLCASTQFILPSQSL